MPTGMIGILRPARKKYMTEQKVRTEDVLTACRTGRFDVRAWRVDAMRIEVGVFVEQTILLVVAGKGRFVSGDRDSVPVAADRIILCPADCCYRLTAEVPLDVLVVRIDGVRFGRSADFGKDTDRGCILLRMTSPLREYTHCLACCLAAGMEDDAFVRLKVCELLYLLRVCYPESVAVALEAGKKRDMDFVRLVERNWNKVRNKAELATVAGLSISHLGVKFRESFGKPPYQWLTERRCEAIYQRLVYGRETFRKIGADFHFRSAQHFNDFCKKHFGATPGVIRRTGGNRVVAVDVETV